MIIYQHNSFVRIKSFLCLKCPVTGLELCRKYNQVTLVLVPCSSSPKELTVFTIGSVAGLTLEQIIYLV